MAIDIRPELASTLDGMSVTGGGRTATFNYTPWGRHYEAPEPVLTIQSPANPTEPVDIGGGADSNRQELQVHAIWADTDDITDMDAWRRAIVYKIKQLVRATEKSLGDAWYVRVRNIVDLDDPVNPDDAGPIVMRYEVAVIIEAAATEVYG